MVACPYGAAPKAGIDPNATIFIDRALWEQVTGNAPSWADFLIDTFTFESITAAQLCTLNLSDPPLPDLGTIAAAFVRDPASIYALWTWVRDKLRYVAFTNT